jgi:hypothetical protein
MEWLISNPSDSYWTFWFTANTRVYSGDISEESASVFGISKLRRQISSVSSLMFFSDRVLIPFPLV